MKYFDAHCHVQLSPYDADREEVLARMKDAEVGGLIVGVDTASSEAAIELVRTQLATSMQQPEQQSEIKLLASVGLHPNDTDEKFDMQAFEEMARQPEVVAIGECGLDYFRPGEPEVVKKIQKEVFEQQIDLAIKYQKPLMIHSRPSKGSQDAYHDTLDMLRSKKHEYGDALQGNMHFFVGGIEEARAFLEIDFSMSYTAVLTFTHDYDEVVRYIPLANLLSETDSPYVSPAPNRGKRNEPTAVRYVIAAFARIRGENVESVRMAVLESSARKFSFSL